MTVIEELSGQTSCDVLDQCPGKEKPLWHSVCLIKKSLSIELYFFFDSRMTLRIHQFIRQNFLRKHPMKFQCQARLQSFGKLLRNVFYCETSVSAQNSYQMWRTNVRHLMISANAKTFPLTTLWSCFYSRLFFSPNSLNIEIDIAEVTN